MLKWICYVCNLRFKEKTTAQLHEKLTDHVCVNEFTNERIENES